MTMASIAQQFTAIILLGQSLLPFTDDASQTFVARFAAVVVAAVLACGGLAFLNALSGPRRPVAPEPAAA